MLRLKFNHVSKRIPSSYGFLWQIYPILISLALGQSFRIDLNQNHNKPVPNHNQTQPSNNMCIILGLYCTFLMLLYCWCISHRDWGKMTAILQTTCSNAFSSMGMFDYQLKFHWNLFLGVPSTIIQHWFRQWLGAKQEKRQLDSWWPSQSMR